MAETSRTSDRGKTLERLICLPARVSTRHLAGVDADPKKFSPGFLKGITMQIRKGVIESDNERENRCTQRGGVRDSGTRAAPTCGHRRPLQRFPITVPPAGHQENRTVSGGECLWVHSVDNVCRLRIIPVWSNILVVSERTSSAVTSNHSFEGAQPH